MSIKVIYKVNTGIECELNIKGVARDRKAGGREGEVIEESMWYEFK